LYGVPPRELAVTGLGTKAIAADFLSCYRPGLLIIASETEREDVPLLQNRYLPDSLRFFVCENLVVRFISNWSFNADSVVLKDWTESDHSHSYGSFSARMFSAAMAS
jgi:hypothetical protein